MVGERASAQSPTHLESLKTASSYAQKASAPTPSAAGVTLFSAGGTKSLLLGSHTLGTERGEKVTLVIVKCNSKSKK